MAVGMLKNQFYSIGPRFREISKNPLGNFRGYMLNLEKISYFGNFTLL